MKRTQVIFNFISLMLCVLLLCFSLFAWYATNKQASVTGGTCQTSEPEQIQFTDTVTSVRHNLSGDVITNTYTRSGINLYLVKTVTTPAVGTETTVTYQMSEKKPFYIGEILPGEYIDITIGYSLADSFDGSSYNVSLRDFGTSDNNSFVLAGKTHYVTGAFKYQGLSLTYGDSKTACADYTPGDETWFTTYNYSQNDSANPIVQILTHTWDKDYGTVYYTFRVLEDFTQYYQLVGKATELDDEIGGNLLSEKTMNIGCIFLGAW